MLAFEKKPEVSDRLFVPFLGSVMDCRGRTEVGGSGMDVSEYPVSTAPAVV